MGVGVKGGGSLGGGEIERKKDRSQKRSQSVKERKNREEGKLRKIKRKLEKGMSDG